MSAVMGYSARRVGRRLKGDLRSYWALLVELALSVLIVTTFFSMTMAILRGYEELKRDVVNGYPYVVAMPEKQFPSGKSALAGGVELEDARRIEKNYPERIEPVFFVHKLESFTASRASGVLSIGIFLVDESFYRVFFPDRPEMASKAAASCFYGAAALAALRSVSGEVGRQMAGSPSYDETSGKLRFFGKDFDAVPIDLPKAAKPLQVSWLGSEMKYTKAECLFFPIDATYATVANAQGLGSPFLTSLMLAPKVEGDIMRDCALACRLVAERHGDSGEYFVSSALDQYRRDTEDLRSLSLVLVIFALFSLAVVFIGLASIFHIIVSRRMVELATSMLVGARRPVLTGEILLEIIAICFAGALAGIAASWLILRSVTLLPESSLSLDPLVAACAVILVVTAGLAAALVPLRKLDRIDPMRVLRSL